MIEGADNNDIGFEVASDTNIFELFVKNQKPGEAPAPVQVTNDSNDPTKTGAVQAVPPTNNPAPAPGAGGDAEAERLKKEKEKETAEKAAGMINKFVLGDKGEGDSGAAGDTGKAGGPADKGTQGSPDNKKTDADNPITVIYNDYTEKGILDKLPEGEEFTGTEEDLDKVIEYTVENRLDERANDLINDAFSKRPEQTQIAQDFIKHLARGGLVSTFLDNNRHVDIKVENLDSDDAKIKTETAKTILHSYYDSIGWDKPTIEKEIARTEAAGADALIDKSRDIFPLYKKAQDAKKQQALNSLSELDTKQKQQILQLNTSIKEIVQKGPEVLGFELKTPKAQQELMDYMYKPAVDYNGKKVPQYYADRIQQQNTPEFQIAQALLYKNKFKIDATKVETQVTKTLKEKLGNLASGKSVTATATGTDNKDRDNNELGIFDFGPESVIELAPRT